MKTPLAWLNFTHQKARSLVAVAGVSFAVILIFMQLGFRGSAEATATLVYDQLDDFEIVLVSSEYRDMNRSGIFPITRLYQAMTADGVARAYPLYIGFNLWRNLQTGGRRSILIIGFNPADKVFTGLPELLDEDVLKELRRTDTVLVDRRSHPDFGLREGKMPAGASATEIGWRKIEVVGQFTLGTGFASDGAVITSERTFARLTGCDTTQSVSLGLLKLKPGADPATVARDLRSFLPGDVKAWTRAELESQERDYWLNSKSIGILFTYGVCVAFFVGVIFVYQIISTDIANHLAEYATLKAIGYGQGYLSGVVLQQAVFLGVLGYLPGLLVALGLYQLTRTFARIPIEMSPGRALGVFVLSLAMCSLSGLFSVRKVQSADPADLF